MASTLLVCFRLQRYMKAPYSAEQWQWLSDLQPKTLRFPGGSSSKFMHLRPYKDANGDGILDSIKVTDLIYLN